MIRDNWNRSLGWNTVVWACAALFSGREVLAETCTVSVLNQSASVRSDGTWVVGNVPANLGEVRARVNCVEGGVLTTATSQRFSIRPDGSAVMNPVGEEPPAPTPARIEVGSPLAEITSAGQPVQLTVTAHYVGGATADVTDVELGTRYSTTNAEIASVDELGRVTAHRSGVVLVVAMHEALVDSVRVSVRLSGDGDGDGMPDDFELANGLDPADPVDAFEDADLDGLTNLEEYQRGTGLADPDSDDDGLTDGREVNLHLTDPLLGDTDGDGLWDGLEIQTGSDPLDPDSFNLAAALASIAVEPPAFVLVHNVVLGEASRQLTVRGNLIDGRTVDITRPPYGTTYSSSDLARISFGPEPGRVHAGSAGAAIVTATNGLHQATSSIDVLRVSPSVLGSISLPGYLNAIAVEDEIAFVAAGAMGLYVVDVSDPAAPQMISRFDTPGNANGVRVVGNVAVVADGQHGVLFLDISSPDAPTRIGGVDTDGDATDLQMDGTLVFVADGDAGVSIVEAADPAFPSILATLFLDGDARGIDLVSDLAVVAADTGGVHIVSVADPSSPTLVATLATRPDGSSHAADVAIHRGLAYVADGANALGGFKVVSLTEPANPVVIAASGDELVLAGIAFESERAFGADHFFQNQFPIFSLESEPPAMVAAPSLNGGFPYTNGQDIAVRDGLFFYPSTSGQSPRGATGVGVLYIGRYAYLGDDVTSPEVELLEPTPQSVVRERAWLTLRARAKDDLRVRRIEFDVNGELVPRLPWKLDSASYRVPAGASSLEIRARAVDLAGNVGESELVQIAVQPDATPQVELLTPSDGWTAAGGSRLTIAASASDDVGVTLVRFEVGGVILDDSVPPYRVERVLPVTTGSVSVSATAFDSVQASETSGPITIHVDGDDPPTAVVLAPRDGIEVVEGGWFDVLGGAADDVRVTNVELLVDGLVVASFAQAPYLAAIPAPMAGSTATLALRARDGLGQEATSPTVTVHGITDPLTSITGSLVLSEGTPVVDGTVVVLSESQERLATSGDFGEFSVDSIPTNDGWLTISGEALLGGVLYTGDLPGAVEPLPGQTIAIGDVILAPASPGGLTVVSGRTVDELEQPVPGAEVEIGTYFDFYATTSAADGTFQVLGVAAEHGGLQIRARGLLGGQVVAGSASHSNPVVDGVSEVGDLLLAALDAEPDPGTTAIGLVLLPDGSPAPGVAVIIDCGARLLKTSTGAEGTFSVPGLPALEGTIRATAGFAAEPPIYGGGSWVEPVPAGTTDLGTIVLAENGGGPGV